MTVRSTGTALRRALSTATSATTIRYSPFASTSSVTLDRPSFDELYPAAERERSPSPSTSPYKQSRGRKARRKNAWLVPAVSPSPSRRHALPRPPRPRADPTQVSPYLPLVTREKNYLLSQFRQSLIQPDDGPASPRTRTRTRRTSTTADDTWTNFVRVLRYPAEEIPTLPRAHFPSSTRRPSPVVTSASSSRGPNTFDPSFPFEPTSVQDGVPDDHLGGRNAIELSLAELHQTFAVFARQRPRTRTGLHRLLVVVELISRHSKQLRRPGSHDDDIDEVGHGPGPGDRVDDGRLNRGGVGLTDREWRQLILFVGTNLRSTRPDPDTKHVLSLFAQREQLRSGSRSGGRRGGRAGTATRVSGDSMEETRMYNALLHVAQRSRMWELFDQVLERMRERGVREDVASQVARLVREGERGSPIEVVWGVFEQGMRWTLVEREAVGGGQGKRARKQSRRVLINALVWILAQRGHFDEAEKIYRAMREGKAIDLNELAPETTTLPTGHAFSPTSRRAPLQVRLPSPDDRLYSSLIQAYAHHGQLRSALMTMYEMIHIGSFSATPVHFHHLFRSFVRFGEGSSTAQGGAGRTRGVHALDWVSLSGLKSDTNRHVSSSSSPLSILSTSSTSSASSVGRRKSRTTETELPTTEFTLAALSTLFESFLALSPPIPCPSRPSYVMSTPTPSTLTPVRLPFEGQRTAPSAQTVYFVLKAFERLLSPSIAGQEGILLQVWEQLEHKFTNGDQGKRGGGRRTSEVGWTGWRMDKRVTTMVQGYKSAVLERETRLNELR